MSLQTNKAFMAKYQCGFSYVEIMVATVLLAVALIPAMDALQHGIQSSTVHENQTVAQYQLTAKLEDVLAQPFGSLDAAATAAGSPTTITTYSDTAGSTNRRLVYLSRYDGDNADADNDPFTGIDAGLIWVRVELEATSKSIETLTSQ